ncbi:MAG: DUF885 domain-containing protein [Opitutales bacterium]|nr:DUF885 domain-containing protein [Opitutales bacterium]MBT6380771.1 DUF885 domain-containing protein [Opitutales bacterium]MBT6769096.1 DUF885 domain-containing protein [Opitutales bacterium]MBT7865630.1 DUF885 domain-containing protein [Opitutales bacterium]
MRRVLILSLLLLVSSTALLNAGLDPKVVAESEKANAFFERIYNEKVDRFPEWQTYLGIKKDYGEWNNDSDEIELRELEFTKENVEWLKSSIDYDLLDLQTKISYRLALQNAEDAINRFKYRLYNYPVNQMFGRHTDVASFLINMHLVTEASDAEAYVSRLNGVGPVFEQLLENLKLREELGVVPPRFVFPMAIESCRNIISGAPFDESGEDSALWEDFRKKLQALDMEEPQKVMLQKKASEALVDVVKPAYNRLIAFLEKQEAKATTEDGVWKFKDGAAFYDQALRLTTTTKLSSDEIHQIGLKEVARIHNEMRGIMKTVEFGGNLQAFFEFMRTDKQFYYPNDDEGKQDYLDRAVEVIDDMKGRLDQLFLTKPKAELTVKRVEAFREKSAGTAFYQRPAPDGSRPGIYYANLYNTANMPKYKLEALAYHEGIPGHHMQLALAQQLEGIPKFRKLGGYTAYIEGWGLYCEQIPKEMGLYKDSYSDFGRLSMELWRACRLVVDTGIHAKRWTREQGIAYYRNNTPDTERDCIRMVERHIVMASQATAYKIGMLKILELREKAKNALGSRFDIRVFHDVILRGGPLPLTVLEQMVDEYIESE